MNMVVNLMENETLLNRPKSKADFHNCYPVTINHVRLFMQSVFAYNQYFLLNKDIISNVLYT